MAGNDDVVVRVGADTSALDSALGNAESTIRSFASGTQSALGGIGDALESIKGSFTTAFAATGILVAVEAMDKLLNKVKELTDRAIQLKTFADTIGVSVQQFQAMKVAADDTGVSTNTMARAGEKLAETLNDARNNSASAIETLRNLGVTTAQLDDPLFTANELMTNLHQRLNDASTAQSTHNELLKLFGLRMATAIEAIAKYDGSQEGVKKALDEVNGLLDKDNNELVKQGIALKHLGETLENSVIKAYTRTSMAVREFLSVLMTPAASAPALAGIFGTEAPKQAQQAEAAMEEVTVTYNRVTKEQLEAQKQVVDETKAGTEQRIAALKKYAQMEQEFYMGKPVEQVRQTNTQIVDAERELTDRRKQFLTEWANYYVQKSYEIQTREEERDARIANQDNELLRKQKAFIDEWEAYYQQQTIKNVTAHNEQNLKIAKADDEVVKKLEQDWKHVADSIGNAFGNAIMGILTKTASFADVMRSLFLSILNDIVNGLARMAAEWVEKLIITKVVNSSTAASQVASNAAVAATAAMASAAAIPFYGWAMAPEVGAATYGEAMAYSIGALAEQGFDVPVGLSPVTQLHPQEMVLPKQYADVIRAMAERGEGRGGGDVHLHVHALDAKSFSDYMAKPANRTTLAKALSTHMSRGGGR